MLDQPELFPLEQILVVVSMGNKKAPPEGEAWNPKAELGVFVHRFSLERSFAETKTHKESNRGGFEGKEVGGTEVQIISRRHADTREDVEILIARNDIGVSADDNTDNRLRIGGVIEHTDEAAGACCRDVSSTDGEVECSFCCQASASHATTYLENLGA